MVLLAVVVSSAAADTIVLKNGRRIVASHVTEEGEHVTYETPAGQMSIPRSIVARIERDDFGYASSARPSAEPPVTPPRVDPVRGYDEVAGRAVHGGSINFAYLAQLETEARSGSAVAAAKVAVAHDAAAQFLFTKGDINGAIDHYRRALIFAPENLGLLLNLAVLYLRESQFTTALDPLDRARRASPSSPDVAKLMGWAYYGANQMDRAIEQWKRAEELRPDPEVERALEKARRDKAEEDSYREGETAHFALRYAGSATPELARGILRTLETHFRDIESALDYTPSEPISVVLYTEQAFADITRAPSWAGAINDGRIRIPVQGLTSVTPELAQVLKHELTHSFITQKTRGRCPTWLQEGIAQYMEGRRSGSAAAALVAAGDHGAAPSLADLEGSWMGLSGASAVFAYAWSLAAVEAIVQTGGMSDISRLLDRLASSASTDAALRETLHSDYADFGQQTITYLRRAYLH